MFYCSEQYSPVIWGIVVWTRTFKHRGTTFNPWLTFLDLEVPSTQLVALISLFSTRPSSNLFLQIQTSIYLRYHVCFQNLTNVIKTSLNSDQNIRDVVISTFCKWGGPSVAISTTPGSLSPSFVENTFMRYWTFS